MHDICEPQTFQEAVTGPERNQWWAAMESEYQSIRKNDTWEVCSLPANRTVVGSRWVYKKKINADGSTR